LRIRGIQLTPVDTRCRFRGYGGRLPTQSAGIRAALRHGGGVPRVCNETAVAGWIRLSGVWRSSCVADEARSVDVCRVRASGLADRGDDLPGHAQAAAGVVPGDVVGDDAEDGGQCVGTSTRVGAWDVLDGVDVAAQVAQSDGAARARSAEWGRRGRRDVLGSTGKGRDWAPDSRKDPDHCCSPTGREANWPHSSGTAARSDQEDCSRVHSASCGAWKHHRHGRAECVSGTGGVRTSSDRSKAPTTKCQFAFAPGSPGGVSLEALASWHTPGFCSSRALGLLPRRIHLPVQPSDIDLAWQVVLPTDAERHTGRTSAVQGLGQTRQSRPKPQAVVSTGVN